jgi:ABC-type sugar transport system permease subunit
MRNLPNGKDEGWCAAATFAGRHTRTADFSLTPIVRYTDSCAGEAFFAEGVWAMETNVGVRRPRVWGLAALLLISAVVNIFGGLTLNQAIDDIRFRGGQVESWVPPLAYLTVIIGVGALVAALLVMRYRRIGLVLCGLLYALGLALNVLSVLTGSLAVSAPLILNTIISLAVVATVINWLTDPERSQYFS